MALFPGSIWQEGDHRVVHICPCGEFVASGAYAPIYDICRKCGRGFHESHAWVVKLVFEKRRWWQGDIPRWEKVRQA